MMTQQERNFLDTLAIQADVLLKLESALTQIERRYFSNGHNTGLTDDDFTTPDATGAKPYEHLSPAKVTAAITAVQAVRNALSANAENLTRLTP